MDVDQQLLNSSRNGDLEGVKAALAQGASVNSQGELGNTALNEAAEHGHINVIEYLLENEADMENVGGADKTPLMNAAFGFHLECVQLLIQHGAILNNDLMVALKTKINTFEEQSESGVITADSVKFAKDFYEYMLTHRMAQDLSGIIDQLPTDDSIQRFKIADYIAKAAVRGVIITPAVSKLTPLLDDTNRHTRLAAIEALAYHYCDMREHDQIKNLFELEYKDAPIAILPALVTAAMGKEDLSGLLPNITVFLNAENSDFRHDSRVVLGYLATNGIDVLSYLPQVVSGAEDSVSEVRRSTAWCLYRMGKHLGDISEAHSGLTALLSDENEKIQSMAKDALETQENRAE
jgi:hypothetical protein